MNLAKSSTNTHSESEDPKNANDVIVIDDEGADCEFINLVPESTGNTRCINYQCKGGVNLLKAPQFCLTYYRINNKTEKLKICTECYNEAIEHFDVLASAISEGAMLADIELPTRCDVVAIDSDSEDEEESDDRYIDEAEVNVLVENLDDVLSDTVERYDFEAQVNYSVQVLKEKLNSVNESFLEVRTMYKSVFVESDRMIFELSNCLAPSNIEQQVIDIDENGTTTVIRDSKDSDMDLIILQESDNEDEVTINDSQIVNEVTKPPTNLPPKAPIVKPPLKVGETYYANRSEMIGAWHKVRLSEIIPSGTKRDGQIYGQVMYLVSIENRQKNIQWKVISGKEIAYAESCPVQLEVGARIIAVFKDSVVVGETKKLKKDSFYPGIIAEPLLHNNKYRYLVFFDDGYSQYVTHDCVHLIYDAHEDIWEDINVNSRAFIKKYLEMYPERPMVKLMKNQSVRTEYNGKWWITTVMNVDCSLVQMFFDATNRIEWIYRGSTRLNPMFKEEQAASSRATNKLQHNQRIPRRLNSSHAPYIEYTRSDDSTKPPVEQQHRSVARKTTSKVQQINNNITSDTNPFLPTESKKDTSATKIVYYTPRRQKPKADLYTPHCCSPKCAEKIYCSLSRLKGYSPLSKPLLCGFYRLLYKIKTKKVVMYKGPCGRMLRNMFEVHSYLRILELDLTVDLFDFNVFVRCLAEYIVDPKSIIIADLSKSLEECPITVVNCIDGSQLDFFNYSTRREPMEGVDLNVDKEFLSGCECEDDCRDRTKCSCWQLTLNCLRYMDKDTDPASIGYQYRRLPEPIFSGIFECNSRCKCAHTCLNRVVQNPLQHKLQIFKTDSKGWGIRCLNDIPQGSFICIYAGALLTDDMANQGGKSYGDEYLAELDFIETVERAKSDYEEEAYEGETSKDKTPEESGEEDNIEDTAANTYNQDSDFIPHIHPSTSDIRSGIRTRSHKRKFDEIMQTVKEEPAMTHDKSKVIIIQEDTVTISDDEDEPREPSSFNPRNIISVGPEPHKKCLSVREMFGKNESVYIMDAKNIGNIGRFLNHSCSPNIFVQNVFVDTHDVRFPWVAFFAMSYIKAGSELTWNYNYEVGSVQEKVLYCYCGSSECKGRLL